MDTSGRLRAARARSSARASASVAAGGRSSAPAHRMDSGIAADISSSTEPYPTVLSIAAMSSGDGPMCRPANVSSVIGSTPDRGDGQLLPLCRAPPELPTRVVLLPERFRGGIAPSAPLRADSPTRVYRPTAQVTSRVATAWGATSHAGRPPADER